MVTVHFNSAYLGVTLIMFYLNIGVHGEGHGGGHGGCHGRGHVGGHGGGRREGL